MAKKKTDTKPTKEELKAKEKEAIEAAEELEGSQQIPKEETPEEIQEETPEPEEPAEEELETIEKEEVEEKELKKKLSASARENQKIYAKNRVLNKALIDTDEIPEPTEEQLQVEFADWDVMSDVEKTLAKETVISRNWRAKIKQAQDQAKKIEKWNESVSEFVSDPKVLNDNPELEGKTEEFSEFATQESNNSVPFNVLVGAFLHEQGKAKTTKKRMFERGSGGPNEKPQPKANTITLEEARKLRETNYAKYKEYLTSGRIEANL